MEILDVGEKARIVTSWWDADGDAAEPTSIEITVTAPDGATTVYHKADLVSLDTAPATLDSWLLEFLITADGVWRVEPTAVVDGDTQIRKPIIVLTEDDSADPGPCDPWCTWEDVAATCPATEGIETLSGAVQAQILRRATWILYMLDGARYPGICSTTRNICKSCSTCRSSCCCEARDALDLKGRYPVFAVWDVTIDGEVIPSTSYKVRDRRWLVRTDDEHWPSCTDLNDDDAFRISWAFGRNPPAPLRDACALFAAEMAKSCLGLECALPSRVTSVNREGVTYVVLDSQKFLDEGRTGIYDVDLALIAARPPAKREGSFPGGGSPLKRRRLSTHRND